VAPRCGAVASRQERDEPWRGDPTHRSLAGSAGEADLDAELERAGWSISHEARQAHESGKWSEESVAHCQGLGEEVAAWARKNRRSQKLRVWVLRALNMIVEEAEDGRRDARATRDMLQALAIDMGEGRDWKPNVAVSRETARRQRDLEAEGQERERGQRRRAERDEKEAARLAARQRERERGQGGRAEGSEKRAAGDGTTDGGADVGAGGSGGGGGSGRGGGCGGGSSDRGGSSSSRRAAEATRASVSANATPTPTINKRNIYDKTLLWSV